MKHISIFGAGKSSAFLIDYLVTRLPANDWHLTLLDADVNAARTRLGNAPRSEALELNVTNEADRKKQVASSDLVISLLPPSLHYFIALDCIECGKHLLTASYLDPKIQALEKEIGNKGILFLCEMGLDPGIDHMSAMKIIHKLQHKNARIISFRSHCGGLVAPESDDNPWHYKISWNPRNVVLAGKPGAIYLENSQEVRLGYDQLFDAGRQVAVEGLGNLSYYPNRDSLSYIDLYRLHGIADFIRTTLRHPEFCSGWQKIIAFGLTDEETLYNTHHKTLKVFFQEHFQNKNIVEKDYYDIIGQMEFLGLGDDATMINKGVCSAADVLQFILEKKLALKSDDKDMIVMLHEIAYTLNGKTNTLRSSLIVKGDDNVHTAMAKTVGLPLGIAAKLVLQEEIKARGLHIPITADIYEPVLAELETLGIMFRESE